MIAHIEEEVSALMRFERCTRDDAVDALVANNHDLYGAAYWLRDRQRPPRNIAYAGPAWVDFASAALLRAEAEFGPGPICQPGLTPSIEQTKAPPSTVPDRADVGPPWW